VSSDSLKNSCKDAFEGSIYKAIFVRARLQGDFVIGSPNPYFYRANFFELLNHVVNFDFSENHRRIFITETQWPEEQQEQEQEQQQQRHA